MNQHIKFTKRAISSAVIALMTSQQLYAGAFSLYTESSTVAVGNYAAGVAAEGADASIGWYNPAGLVLLKKQEALLSGVGVLPSTKMSGTSTYVTEGIPAPYVQSFSNLQGAESAVVPAFHYALPLGEKVAFGFSIVSPFGLSTSWGTASPLRYSATYTQLMMINASPELGGKITDNLAVGLGLDLQWARVTFNTVIGAPAALQFLESIGGLVTPTTLDSTSVNKGNSFGVGFHAGVLGMFNDNHSRLGLNYQSGIAHRFLGNSTLTGRLADPMLTNPNATFRSDVLMSNNVQLPDIVTLSGYQDLTEKLALLGSVVYSAWSTFEAIELKNIAAFSVETGTQALVNSTSIEDYRNAWRFALGANYHVNDQWMLRAGGGYDQTPTVNAQRDVRLPDSDRWALSIGAHYQVLYNVGLDAGYTYLFGSNNVAINKTQNLGPGSSNTINATAKTHAQLIGLQAVWDIDKPAPSTK
jgi:long-chain fatty acid transport protein